MKIKVDQDMCIGCGMCLDICPEIFKLNSDDKSECTVDEIPDNLKEKAKDACDICPVDAISEE